MTNECYLRIFVNTLGCIQTYRKTLRNSVTDGFKINPNKPPIVIYHCYRRNSQKWMIKTNPKKQFHNGHGC